MFLYQFATQTVCAYLVGAAISALQSRSSKSHSKGKRVVQIFRERSQSPQRHFISSITFRRCLEVASQLGRFFCGMHHSEEVRQCEHAEKTKCTLIKNEEKQCDMHCFSTLEVSQREHKSELRFFQNHILAFCVLDLYFLFRIRTRRIGAQPPHP